MEVTQLKKTLFILKNIVKYGIFIVSAFATLHCFLLFMGYDIVIIHFGLCIFALLLGLYLSKLFGLCWVHRLSVFYIVTVLICIVMRRHDLFSMLGISLHLARGIMFCIGMVLQVLVIWKLKTKSC